MKNFYCFIHIPKCGGLTFESSIQRNLGCYYKRVSHEFHEEKLAKKNVSLYIKELDVRRGIGGHRLSLELPFGEIVNTNIIAISSIRSPLERIRSNYFYVKQLPNISQNYYMRESNSYQEYLERILNNPSTLERIKQSQSKALFGRLDIDIAWLESLISSKKVFLFPTEKMSDFCVCFEKIFFSDFPDMSYRRTNVNKKNKIKELTELELKLKDTLLEDNYLYQLACRSLDDFRLEAFPVDDDFNNHKKNLQKDVYSEVICMSQ